MKANKTGLFFAFQIAAFIFLSSAAFAQESGTWATKSSSGFTARSEFGSAVVNGKIYVIGGSDGSSQLYSLEVYDPTADTWSTPTTSGIFTARSQLTASTVNGKIYVIGGSDGSPTALNTLEVYDPATNTWSTPATTGTFTGRRGHTSSVVNGKIYIIGGTHTNPSSLSTTIEVFDPATNAWTTLSTTGTYSPRWSFSSSALNGKIYTMGGSPSGGTSTNKLEIFDPATNSWSTPLTTGTFTPRGSFASAVVGGKIYAMGGSNGSYLNTLEAFDPVTNIWSTPTTTGTFTAREGFAVSTVNSQFYALGGFNGYRLNTNEAYTPYVAPPSGTLSLGENQLNFGAHDYTKDSMLIAKVYNKSATAVSIDQTTITGTNAADFKVLSNTKQANLPYQLQPGDSIGFVIQYTAPSVTESDNATFRVLFDGSADSIRTITLTGSSQKPTAPKQGYITVAVNQINFGAHDYGKDSSITAMVYNPSPTGVTITSLVIAGTNAADFIIGNTPQYLQPGDSIGFVLQYIAPAVTETDNAIFRIFFDQSSDSGVRSITLTGSAKKPSGNAVPVLGKTGLSVSIYPNPAKSEMHINYAIPNHSDVVLNLFDMTGKEVMMITNETSDAGSYEKLYNVKNIANGSYILKLSACGKSVTKVIEIVK